MGPFFNILVEHWAEKEGEDDGEHEGDESGEDSQLSAPELPPEPAAAAPVALAEKPRPITRKGFEAIKAMDMDQVRARAAALACLAPFSFLTL